MVVVLISAMLLGISCSFGVGTLFNYKVTDYFFKIYVFFIIFILCKLTTVACDRATAGSPRGDGCRNDGLSHGNWGVSFLSHSRASHSVQKLSPNFKISVEEVFNPLKRPVVVKFFLDHYTNALTIQVRQYNSTAG